jgi:hypothetical protein
MSSNKEIGRSDRTRKLRHLQEFVAALDRRVPNVERTGETEIAREGHALREKALQRIAELEASLEISRIARPRGPVDAPGKRHRKPPPQESIDKRMGEPQGKQMGQKRAKTALRGRV